MKRLAVALVFLILSACAGVGIADRQPPQQLSTAFQSDRMVVRVEGQGSDVILIPGLSSSPTVWANTVRSNPGYRFHLVHLNGFAGQPARGNAQGLVTASAAEEVARYISTLRLDRPELIGHSMGGTVAMMIAARHPDQVGRVMVVDMVPWVGAFFGPPGATIESVRPVADQIRAGMSGPPSPQGEAMLTQTINGMIKTESLRAGVLAESRASDRGVSARAYHELITTDLRPELPRITAPVTVLYVRPPGFPGTDAQMDAFYAQAYAGLRGASLKRIPEAWHFIMFDQPEAFQAEVRSFLAPS